MEKKLDGSDDDLPLTSSRASPLMEKKLDGSDDDLPLTSSRASPMEKKSDGSDDDLPLTSSRASPMEKKSDGSDDDLPLTSSRASPPVNYSLFGSVPAAVFKSVKEQLPCSENVSHDISSMETFQMENKPILDTPSESGSFMASNDASISFQRIRPVVVICVQEYDSSLPEDITKTALKDHFSSCGTIVRVDISPIEDKRCAYLSIIGDEAEEKALQLNGSLMGEKILVVSAERLPTDWKLKDVPLGA